MNKYFHCLTVVILILLNVVCKAVVYYVRPLVTTNWNAQGIPIPTEGIYGSQDGSSFENSFNGLTSVNFTNIVAGDTLYVCDSHIYTNINYNYNYYAGIFTNVNSGTEGNPIFIRGDYINHPGKIYGYGYGSNLWGFRIDIKTNSHITFKSIHFDNVQFINDRTVAPEGGSRNIVFDGCTLSNYTASANNSVVMVIGNYWTVTNCIITHADNGISSSGNYDPTFGFIAISNTIVNIGIGGYESADAHAIGIQNTSGCIITGNYITNTGSAIEFFNGASDFMTNNEVSYNFIKDVRVCSVTAGGGITVSGMSSSPGYRSGYSIHHNIIINTGLNGTNSWEGYGISWNSSDGATVNNNIIYNTKIGVAMIINDGYPYNADIHNNIIIQSISKDIAASGGSVGSFYCDNNLIYPTGVVTMSPTNAHDLITTYADPKFVNASTNSTSLEDFQLSISSPIYGLSGTNAIGYWDMSSLHKRRSSLTYNPSANNSWVEQLEFAE